MSVVPNVSHASFKSECVSHQTNYINIQLTFAKFKHLPLRQENPSHPPIPGCVIFSKQIGYFVNASTIFSNKH